MERRIFDGDVHALAAPDLRRRGVLALFTERTGGVSDGPFRSLNLGFHVGDRMARVQGNRRRIVETFGLPTAPSPGPTP